MRLRRHPRDRQLRLWLTGDTPPAVEAHVEGCDRCATRLEQLDGADLETDGTSQRIRTALETTLAAPPGLAGRLATQVHAQQQQISLGSLFLDVVGGGVDTLRLLTSEGDLDA